MSLCPTCMLPLSGDQVVHAYHLAVESGWADTNRAMCDLLHRKIPLPAKLSQADREVDRIVAEYGGVSDGTAQPSYTQWDYC